MRKETEDWGNYKRLSEEIPESLLFRRMLLGADSVVDTPRLRAFEINERKMAKFSESMDPCCVGRNAALLQYTQFASFDESTRRRMSNAATPKPGSNCNERQNRLPRSCTVSVTNVRPELVKTGKLLTRTALAPFGFKEIGIQLREHEDPSVGKLVVSNLPTETMNEEQGQGRMESEKMRRKKTVNRGELMEQDPEQVRDDDKASVDGASSLDFIIWKKTNRWKGDGTSGS